MDKRLQRRIINDFADLLNDAERAGFTGGDFSFEFEGDVLVVDDYEGRSGTHRFHLVPIEED